MPKFQELSPEEASDFLRKKTPGAIRVKGLIDLQGAQVKEIKATVQCQDFDATGSQLVTLPKDMKVESRLVLDDCNHLESLPVGLKCGSLSLRNCGYLDSLPEKLSTWFLDMTGCQRFSNWPKKGTIHRGSLILRNCVEVRVLPPWLELLSQLDVSGCLQLNELPDGLRISSWLDLGGANIGSLPPSLKDVPLRWRSVAIDEQIAFHPEKITSKAILKETNTERRRVMIERMGYLKFSQEAGAKTLDTDTDPGGERKLLRIELEDDENLVGLFCSCPSTARQYFLRVPPTITTCHQAAAWMAGFDDPKKYKPAIET